MTHDAPHLTIDVRVRAAARREGVARDAAGGLRVAVHQAPERGKANAAVVEQLAEALGLRRGQFEIVAGRTSPRKRIRVAGLSAAELERRIAALPE